MSFKLYRLLVNGLHSGLFRDLSCRDKFIIAEKCIIPLRELLVSEDILEALRYGWIYNVKHKYWFKNNIKFKHMRHYIIEVFDYGDYLDIDVNGELVLDIGAGYGETAIYFSKRGASRVIAIEPCPSIYSEMLENLELNNIKDKVIPVNTALASTHRYISIKCPNGTIIIETTTLRDLVEKFNIQSGVLKMDCEGCEYDIILNNYEYVKLFNKIYFEYHAYITKTPITLLLKKLTRDYVCKIISDKDYYEKHGFNKTLLGIIKCSKK